MVKEEVKDTGVYVSRNLIEDAKHASQMPRRLRAESLRMLGRSSSVLWRPKVKSVALLWNIGASRLLILKTRTFSSKRRPQEGVPGFKCVFCDVWRKISAE